jgi:transposase-like protein
LAKIVADFEQQAPAEVTILERAVDDPTAALALLLPYRKRLSATNRQVRLNEKTRRRERVIRIFPRRASAIRLLGALLLEQDEQWSAGKRYVDMAIYWSWLTTQHGRSAGPAARATPTTVPDSELNRAASRVGRVGV